MLNTNTATNANRNSRTAAKGLIACALAAALTIGGASIALAAPSAQGSTCTTTATATTTQKSGYIGDKAALKAALKDAGLDAKNCVEIETELDLDDVTPHYDVSVKSGGREYEYDIDAYSGAILTRSVEIDD